MLLEFVTYMKLLSEKFPLIVFVVAVITGCSAVSSRDISAEDYTGYVLGMSTYQDVIQKLGHPDEFYYPDNNCRNFAGQCNYFAFVYFDTADSMYLYSFKKDKLLFSVKTHEKCRDREGCLLDAERYLGHFVSYHKTMGDYSQENFPFEKYIPDFSGEEGSFTVSDTNQDDSVLYETQSSADNSDALSHDNKVSEDDNQKTAPESAGSENNRFNENDSLDDFAD